MTAKRKTGKALTDPRVNVKIKLAAIWGTLLFIYIYVDIFSFFKPGTLQDILAGKVWEFEISQTWALGALLLMTIPSLMVILSLVLKAAVNRWLNIITAVLYILVGIGTMIGETWAFYFVGHLLGIVLLLLIILTAIRWPVRED